LIELEKYEGALNLDGYFMDIGVITTVTKDPAEKGTMSDAGNGVFYNIKFLGSRNRGIAKAFGKTGRLLQELVANAELTERQRPLTQKVIVKGYAQDSANKNEDGTWNNYPMNITIDSVYDAEGVKMTALWSQDQD
tara:strand:- start:37 stop:444 length:408 start_codon:yes stop_codon:yes gene_type:complete